MALTNESITQIAAKKKGRVLRPLRQEYVMKESEMIKTSELPEQAVKSVKTVGEEAYKRLLNPDHKQEIVETQREIDKEYYKELEECVNRGKKLHFGDDDFFVVVVCKKERLMENVIRRYFFPRQTLPTPDFDQTVWRYKKDGYVEFIWTIPDHNTCQEMLNYPDRYPFEEKELVNMVRLFMEGVLYHQACKHFNIPVDVDTEAPPYLKLKK